MSLFLSLAFCNKDSNENVICPTDKLSALLEPKDASDLTEQLFVIYDDNRIDKKSKKRNHADEKEKDKDAKKIKIRDEELKNDKPAETQLSNDQVTKLDFTNFFLLIYNLIIHLGLISLKNAMTIRSTVKLLLFKPAII